MSVDLTEFETRTGRHYPCHVAELDLSDEQRAKLNAACGRADISSAAIARVLEAWERPICEATIRKHRRGACQCKNEKP
jgi:hypothetical protein